MARSRLHLLCFVAVTMVTTADGRAAMAPMRCHPPKGAVAATICGSKEYLAMDREIAALTDRGMAQFAPSDRGKLGQSELRYFKQREGCTWAAHNSAHPGAAVDECVRARMEDRVRSLRVLVERGGF